MLQAIKIMLKLAMAYKTEMLAISTVGCSRHSFFMQQRQGIVRATVVRECNTQGGNDCGYYQGYVDCKAEKFLVVSGTQTHLQLIYKHKMTFPRKSAVSIEQVKQPNNVKVLILSENKTSLKEFYYIKSYSNLIKIDLSYNKLSSFPTGFSFATFSKLRTLFLHYNKFSSLKSLTPVVECKRLQYLTLFGNPLEQAKARHLFVNQISGMMLMDDKIVKIEQRCQQLILGESQTKVLTFPLLSQPNEEEKVSTDFYLQNVVKELTMIRKYYLKVNPVIRIQRWWKHLLKRKNRKWKVYALPQIQRVQSMSNIQQSRRQLTRLMTQKMEISKSKEQKMFALLRQNVQFWTAFQTIVNGKALYLSREYCRMNAIEFTQINQFKVIRNIELIDKVDIHKKRLLAFFIGYHSRIIVDSTKKQKEWKRIDHLSIKRLSKKYEMNAHKSLLTDQKLKALQNKYAYYVKPKFSQVELLKIIKKEYFKYMRSLFMNFQPQPFPVLSQRFLQRAKAAVTIQRCWKGSLVRKNLNACKQIRQKQAAIKIQKWIRGLKFQHRYKFILEIGTYLKSQKNNIQIILEMEQIPAIQQYCTYKENFGKNFMICFQECLFSIQKISSKNKITFYSQRQPDPPYLNLSFKTVKDAPFQVMASCILQILFKQAKSIDKITDSKGSKYIRFTYETVEEALNRKFILALKTYSMIKHQFIYSVSPLKMFSQFVTNLIESVNQNSLVSVMDANLDQSKGSSPLHTMKVLQNKKSVTSLNTGLGIVDDGISMKIRFFVGKVDFSCILFIKQPSYGKNKQIVHDKSEESMHLGYYLGRKKSLSKRYDAPITQNVSKISRHIISLQQLGEVSASTSRKNTIVYPKILNTDQSHSILDSSNLYESNKIQTSRYQVESHDRFDKEVYPTTQVIRESLKFKKDKEVLQELRYKKSLIEDIKTSHKDKLAKLVTKKMQSLEGLQREKSREHIQTQAKLARLKEQLEKQKALKHDKVRKHFRDVPNSAFESQFLQKGIKSMNRNMRQYEKKSKTFRYQKVLAESQDDEKIKGQLRRGIQKTQIRQFEMNFSEADLKSSQNERSIVKSEEEGLLKSIPSKQQSLTRNKSQQMQNSEVVADKAEPTQRRRSIKKKMVHSVFPQQFYPIKRGNQIGFELPKIHKY